MIKNSSLIWLHVDQGLNNSSETEAFYVIFTQDLFKSWQNKVVEELWPFVCLFRIHHAELDNRIKGIPQAILADFKQHDKRFLFFKYTN